MPHSKTSILHIKIDNVDFSFDAIPITHRLLDSSGSQLKWSGVRLKPIAPIVLAWARGLLALAARARDLVAGPNGAPKTKTPLVQAERAESVR
jgi:hypothetical protein